MGSADVQGRLWSHAATDWAEVCEPLTQPLHDATLAALAPQRDWRCWTPDAAPGRFCGRLPDAVRQWRAGLVNTASGEVDFPFIYPDLPTARRGQASIGPFRRAIEIAGEDIVRKTFTDALAPFRQPDGSYRPHHVFRYVIAGKAT